MSRYDDYFDRVKLDYDRGFPDTLGRDDSLGGDRTYQNQDRTSDFGGTKPLNSLSDNVRLYVTLRKGIDSPSEYKKLILMTPVNIKVSMLKRAIEREFADLFPREPTFIVGKLEDQYGYALSNSSFIFEILKNGDRITAFPEDIFGGGSMGGDRSRSPSNVQQNDIGIKDREVTIYTGDITELLYMLKNIQQSICQKLADSDLKNYTHMVEALYHVMPLGFSPSKVIVHNCGVCILKAFSTERLYIFEEKEGSVILNLVITLLNYWIAELISTDNFLLSSVTELLEILIKSAVFCQNFKGGFVLSNLMNVSNLGFISTQTKSRLVKIVSYLSKGEFRNYYSTQSVDNLNLRPREDRSSGSQYVPSFMDKDKLANLGRTSPLRGEIFRDKARSNTVAPTDPYTNQNDMRDVLSNPTPSTKQYRMVDTADQAFNNKFNEKFFEKLKSGKSGDYSTGTGGDLNKSGIQGGNEYKSNNNMRRGGDDLLYKDYINLLTSSNAREMHVYAVQNLEPIIEKVIDMIMSNREEYLKLSNLVELELPVDYENGQIKILTVLEKALSEDRAIEGLQKGIIQKLLKAFSYQPSSLHNCLMMLLQTHIVRGKYRVDISTIISIILSPYTKLHDFAIKALSIMSDPNIHENMSYDIQFENHIKLLIDLTLSKKKSYEFRNLALQTLANVALKDNLKPQILYNRGLETLLYHLRNDENLDGQRLAAKALLNLSSNSRDTKLKIITELGDEIKRMHRNELDPIVQGYVQSLVNTTR